jgi:hypothetical protein
MIGDEGIIRIAEGLEENTSLEELDLGGAIYHFICFILHSFLQISLFCV